jgi:hypothetical protein
MARRRALLTAKNDRCPYEGGTGNKEPIALVTAYLKPGGFYPGSASQTEIVKRLAEGKIGYLHCLIFDTLPTLEVRLSPTSRNIIRVRIASNSATSAIYGRTAGF